jgi:alkylhydroperoxidase/carboxymuconolactone decarboxylase family protein YurZ
MMTATRQAPDATAVEAALEQIHRTHGHVPDGFRILAEHAPEAFLGYMGLREFVFRPPPEGHLDLWTKEFIFVLLDIQAGNIRGARNHLRNAMRAGLTIGQLTEGLVQLIMVGGITAWNMGGREILEFAIEIERDGPPSPG